jgi:hypothetical protein
MTPNLRELSRRILTGRAMVIGTETTGLVAKRHFSGALHLFSAFEMLQASFHASNSSVSAVSPLRGINADLWVSANLLFGK